MKTPTTKIGSWLSTGTVLLGCALGHADTLFVGNFSNNTIDRVDSSGHESVFANAGLHAPLGLAFDTSGNL